MKSVSEKKSKVGLPTPVVAIGASAGGQEAMVELLENLNVSTGMAYIYIQHLDPTHESNLPAILSRSTKMKVKEAADSLKIEPDNLYIIPPNMELTILDGELKTHHRPLSPYNNMPINKFFISLAEAYKEASIGIVLSGAANDGTIGLKYIKEAGGLTFAQNETAKFQTMPKSAAAEGGVDIMLSPKEIAEELKRLSRQKEIYYNAMNELREDSFRDDDFNFISILQMLHKIIGVDFSQYKVSTIKRRILRRMMLFKQESLEQYAQYIRKNPNEVNQLYQDLLINVTTFFRDEATSDYLKKIIFPQILKNKTQGDPLRIWVPACSTGQEVYSLAMLLMETLGPKAAATSIQIFATDLSEAAINKARLGVYTHNEVLNVPEKRLERFFNKVDGHYRIVKTIRDICVFANHNIAKDPPFSKLDLISCCNLLIYLDTNLQKKVLATFHYSLNNNGFLILGKSETVGPSAHLFSMVDKKLKVYNKKKDAIAKAMFEITHRSNEQERITGLKQREVKKTIDKDMVMDRIIDELLLKRYTPASVVVNSDLDILQFRGSTGIYLEPSPGKASLNLLKMARSGLGLELRNLVHKAQKNGVATKKEGLDLESRGKRLNISIEAVPIKTDSDEKYYLVVFEEMVPKNLENAGTIKDNRVKQLEDELIALREDMRSIIESQEAAHEELQSANEEVVSSNEELQSINEELETSKEEIESSNEELITINQELQVRNEQLAEVQEYAEAVFSLMKESLLILDKDLRIKNANAAFYNTFKVKEVDTQGMLLYELGNMQWNIPELRQLLEKIVFNNSAVIGYEVKHEFPNIGEKIMLLNAKKLLQNTYKGQHLILLAIEDVTEYRKAQNIISERVTWFRNMADNAPVLMWVIDKGKKPTFYNKTWLDFCGGTLDDKIEQSWTHCIHPDDKEVCESNFNAAFEQKQSFEIKCRLKNKDGDYKWILVKANPNHNYEGNFEGYIGTCVEIENFAKN